MWVPTLRIASFTDHGQWFSWGNPVSSTKIIWGYKKAKSSRSGILTKGYVNFWPVEQFNLMKAITVTDPGGRRGHISAISLLKTLKNYYMVFFTFYNVGFFLALYGAVLFFFSTIFMELSLTPLKHTCFASMDQNFECTAIGEVRIVICNHWIQQLYNISYWFIEWFVILLRMYVWCYLPLEI